LTDGRSYSFEDAAPFSMKSYYDRSSGVVQFGVPKAVMKVFDYDRFRAIVAAAGITRASFEYSTKTTEPGVGRITCKAELCEPLATAFIEIAQTSKERDIRVGAALAAKAALDVTA
jgi:hypothetical protein